MRKDSRVVRILGVALFYLCTTDLAAPQADVSRLRLSEGSDVVSAGPRLLNAGGQVQVWVKLVDSPVAVAAGANAKKLGTLNGLSNVPTPRACEKSRIQ